MIDLDALIKAVRPMPASLTEVYERATLLMMSEVAALLHDLGKLSKNFIGQKSDDSSLSQQFGNFKHHLILRRLRLQKEPLLPNPGFCNEQQADNWAGQWWDKNRANQSGRGNFRQALKRQWTAERAISDKFLLGQSPIHDEILIGLLNEFDNLLSPPWETSAPCRLGDPLETHHPPCWRPLDERPWLAHLTAACDGLDSAVDKACLNYIGAWQKSTAHISTPFGYEGDPQNWHVPTRSFQIDLDRVDNERHTFCQGLKAALERLKSAIGLATPGLELDRGAVRECRHKVIRLAHQHFVYGLGETRRSANDVTLWDHSFAVASMVKAALAGQLIRYRNEDSVPPPDSNSFRRVLKWRLLCVAFDGVGFVSKGQKMADIIGNWQLVQQAKSHLRELFEAYLPLGNCVYDDENGIYFLVPGIVEENGTLVLDANDENYLRALVEQVFDHPELGGGELRPAVWLSGPDKSLTRLGQEIARGPSCLAETPPRQAPWAESWSAFQTRAEPAHNRQGMDKHIKCPGVCVDTGDGRRAICRHARQDDPWCELMVERHDGGLDTPNIEICPVCQLRPKCEQQDICPACHERRSGRAQNWIDHPKGHTIWIEEIADRSNRCGLIVGHFALSRWLDGSMVPTVLAQSLDWWKLHRGASSPTPFTEAYDEAKKVLNVLRTSDLATARAGLESYNNFVEARHTTPKVVRGDLAKMQEALKLELEEHGFDSDKPGSVKPEEFLWRIFGKFASHGRLRRIWETTEAFWQEVQDLVLPELPSMKSVSDPTRLKRLVLDVEWEGNDRSHVPQLAYELEVSDEEKVIRCRCQVFGVGPAGDGRDRFITIQNLSGIPHTENDERSLESVRFNLDYFGQTGEVRLIPEPGYRRPISERTGKIVGVLTQEDWLKERPRITPKGVEPAEDIPEGIDYLPFLSILASPVSFMAVVPAADGLDVVSTIKQKYDLEFSRVKDRLPLHLGIVYFNRRYPLYVVLDAGRRMLRELPNAAGQDLSWTLKSALENHDQIELDFTNGCKWKVPTRTGDPNVPDECHPRFFVTAKNNLKNSVEKAATFFGPGPTELSGGREQPVIGVQNIPGLPAAGKGLAVVVQPGRFDFEYLDSTVRRLELRYRGTAGQVWRTRDTAEVPRRLPGGEMRGKRPYYFDELDLHDRLWESLLQSVFPDTDPKRRVKQLEAKLKSLGALIEKAYSLWPERLSEGSPDATAFHGFMCNAFPNVMGKEWWEKNQPFQDDLIRVAAEGAIFDMMELRLFLAKGAEEFQD